MENRKISNIATRSANVNNSNFNSAKNVSPKKAYQKTSAKKKKKKSASKNMLKILILVFCVALLVFFININKKISDNDNISKLNAKSYAVQIKNLYDSNQSERISKFLEDVASIQQDVYNYFYSSKNIDKTNEELQKEVNEKFESGNFSDISDAKLIFWNGTWKCDEYGNVVFKFANKDIEPAWIDDSRVSDYIEKN